MLLVTRPDGTALFVIVAMVAKHAFLMVIRRVMSVGHNLERVCDGGHDHKIDLRSTLANLMVATTTHVVGDAS